MAKTKYIQNLIFKYPSLLNSLGNKYIECGNGWYDIIDILCNELQKYPEVRVLQIKQKFWELRVYLHGQIDATISDAIGVLLRAAEEAASITCERCAGPLVNNY